MKRELGLFAGALAFLAGSTSAGTVDLQFVSVAPEAGENISIDSGVTYHTIDTGQFNFLASNPTGSAAAVITPGALRAWCVELGQFVGNGVSSDTFTVLGPAPVSDPYVAPFTNIPGATAKVSALFNQFYSQVVDATTSIAFQLAIWELVMDPTAGDLKTGTFRVDILNSDPVLIQGNSWLSQLNVNASGSWSVFQLHHDTLQDEIFAVQGGGEGQNPTPLPAALPAGAAMLLGLAAVRKIRRKV